MTVWQVLGVFAGWILIILLIAIFAGTAIDRMGR
jgi:hypothetical protein